MALHQPSGRSRLGFALAATTMILWGVLPLALKLALQTLDPVTLTWFRFGVAALVLTAWLGARGKLPAVGKLGRGGSVLLVVSVLGLAANFLTFLIGLDLTSPANSQVLIQLAPMLLGLGSIVVFKERYERLQWIGLGILVAGLLTFFSSKLGAIDTGTDRYVTGSAILVVAAVTWAGYGLAQKQLLFTFGSQPLMLLIYAGCFLCFSLGAHPAKLGALDTFGWGILLFCAANTLVAYGAFAAALEHWEASRVSAVLAITPLATLAFTLAGSALWPERVHPEPVSLLSFVGAFAVVGGSILVTLGARRAVGLR
jgi:drug/metabolite transporter (DMT)-like permease